MKISLEQHMHERKTPERDKMLTAGAAFFGEHGATSWHPDHETPEQGAERTARRDAEFELYALDHGWEVVWEDDFMVDHVREFPDAYDAEPETCETAVLRDADGYELGSLHCIDDASEEYRRVIFTQLAGEEIRELHNATNVEHYYDPKRADYTTDPDVATCTVCGLVWCTVCDGSPSDRCHNEDEHPDPDELEDDDELAAPDAATVTISRAQLEAWAGRRLTDDEIDRLDDAIPNSSIPDAVATIVDNL